MEVERIQAGIFRRPGDCSTVATGSLAHWIGRAGRITLPLVLLAAGCTPSLHDVIGRGEDEKARQMLAADPALVSTTNELGKQPLQYAVMYARKDAMEALVEAGADVNAADNTGMTALHVAAMYGRKGPLRWLLAHGADWSVQDHFGDLPSHTAAIYGQDDALTLLHAAGDSLTGRNRDGRTPLELAIKHRRTSTVELLRSLVPDGSSAP